VQYSNKITIKKGATYMQLFTVKKPSVYVLAMFFAGILGGCAFSYDVGLGPHGRACYTVDAMTTPALYEEAHKKCPGGYDILSGVNQQGEIDFIASIECKLVTPANSNEGHEGHFQPQDSGFQ